MLLNFFIVVVEHKSLLMQGTIVIYTYYDYFIRLHPQFLCVFALLFRKEIIMLTDASAPIVLKLYVTVHFLLRNPSITALRDRKQTNKHAVFSTLCSKDPPHLQKRKKETQAVKITEENYTSDLSRLALRSCNERARQA